MVYREVLSEGEQRLERRRRLAGFVLAPAVFIALYFYPFALDAPAHRLFAVLGLVLVLWLTESIPLPVAALLGAVLNVMLGVAPAKVVLAPFAHPLVFLFIGSFILAEAITIHGLDRRFAFAIFSVRFLQKSPLRVLFAFGAVVALASMWISNTAATAMTLPIALGVLEAMREMRNSADSHGAKGPAFDLRRFSTALMLMVAYGASVGGIATPIGTPPTLIGIGMIQQLAGVRINFFEWMTFALPITAVMFIYLFLLLGRSIRPGPGAMEGMGEIIRTARAGLGRWSAGEVNTALCFGAAVLPWGAPSVAALLFGKQAPLSVLLASRLNEGVVAVFAAALLFFLPISVREVRFTMTWDKAVRIDWSTILLFGGGLSLGELMFSTGLAGTMGAGLTGLTGASTLWSVTAMAVLLGIVLSETTSNTASANMVIPVMIALAQGAGISPIPPALGACLGASFGFMLPVSTPPNAIVYGSGQVPILTMVRKGVAFDIGGFFIIMAGLRVLCPLMGWT